MMDFNYRVAWDGKNYVPQTKVGDRWIDLAAFQPSSHVQARLDCALVARRVQEPCRLDPRIADIG